jgi:hypothetical protein
MVIAMQPRTWRATLQGEFVICACQKAGSVPSKD